MKANRRLVLVERPRYIVPTANCFRLEQGSVPALSGGQLRIRTTWLGMDSMLYSRVQRVSAHQSDPIKLKDVMVGPAVGVVEESLHPDYQAGELVSGFWGWQDYAVSDGRRLRKLDFPMARPSNALSVYGVPGFGAYVALKVLTPVVAGETVVVGTTLGGLGQVAAQIAKAEGCRVIGVSGTEPRCAAAVKAFGIDACLNREAADFAQQLAAHCPQGVDVYVETVGGKVLEAVMPLMRLNGRIAACGLSSTPHYGEAAFKGKYQSTMNFLFEVINRRLTVRGLVVFDHFRSQLPGFYRDMKAWIDAGKVHPLEDVVNGLEHAPEAFQNVFEGRALGKCVVKVSD